jgi:hypothetical protein
LMMQSALSPGYDLSKALRHVRHAYAFYSDGDTIVLSAGTRLLGTVDRVHTDAAGRVGYHIPTSQPAAKEYAKLQQFRYRESWLKYDHIGDHIGPMTRRFAQYIIAPLLLTGKLPEDSTTNPSNAYQN